MTERDFAIDVVRRLQEAGHQALWAGGCVRDELLGITPKDYDIATDARPERVQELFRRTIAVGASFGVIEVMGPKRHRKHLKVQVATFRADVSYSDGRHPDAVVFASAREDALRRDFTINGMFFDPITNQLHDFVGGRQDLQTGMLRAIGAPRIRFAEDKLRLLRAVRIGARFNFKMDEATAAAIKEMAPQIKVVSAERIAEELRQLLVHPNRAGGMNQMFDLGLVDAILPELVPMKSCPQGLPDAPTGNLWEHTMRVLELLGEECCFPLALATLLHDVGKPRTVGRTPDRYTFYGHEHVGARMTRVLGERLRLSVAERERAAWLVEKHQYLSDSPHMRPSKLKTVLGHPGIRELLTLHRADALASGRSDEHVVFCENLLAEWTPEDLNPAPLITGDDLKALGLEPGPQFKQLLDAVREAQLDGTIASRDEAMALIHSKA